MDSNRFDTLVKSLSATDTRRELLRLVAALPLAGALAALLTDESEAGRGHRRSVRNRRRSGNQKDTRKGKRTGKRSCAKAGQTPKKGKRTGCCAGLSKDASGRCAAAAPAAAADPAAAVCTGLRPTDTGPSRTQGLQEAITQAARGGITTLTLCAGTWTLSDMVLIDENLTLIGAGAGATVLDGDNKVGVLYIQPAATVTLRDLTITKGNAWSGGGVANSGRLTLHRVSVTKNTAENVGGGIVNPDGRMLTLESSHVTDNIATGLVGEGWRGRGGGIYNQGGTVALRTGSSVRGNSATNGEGGGIHNSGIEGNVTLQSDSRVTGNTAATGGGIYNYDGTVALEGPDPSPIVVNNCLNNCVGTPVDNCAATPVLCRP